MSKEKFAQELLARLAEKKEWGIDPGNVIYYRDGFTAQGDSQLLDFIHNTNLHYHKSESDVLIGSFLVIKKKCSNDIWSMCRFDMDYLYREFKEGSWNAVWKLIKPQLESGTRLTENGIFSSINNYEAVKEHLIIRPLNYTDHQMELQNCIYRLNGDIALVLYIIFSNDRQGLNTSKIQKSTFREWNMDEDTVWENALMNTCAMAPPRLYANPLDADNAPYAKGVFMTAEHPVKVHPLQVPMVTTTQQVNGAIALFYPGVQERIAEIMGGSYYVAFISIHECMIHRSGTVSPRQIRRHLTDVNNAFSPEENLSRKIFYYDAVSKVFSSLD